MTPIIIIIIIYYTTQRKIHAVIKEANKHRTSMLIIECITDVINKILRTYKYVPKRFF